MSRHIQCTLASCSVPWGILSFGPFTFQEHMVRVDGASVAALTDCKRGWVEVAAAEQASTSSAQHVLAIGKTP